MMSAERRQEFGRGGCAFYLQEKASFNFVDSKGLALERILPWPKDMVQRSSGLVV